MMKLLMLNIKTNSEIQLQNKLAVYLIEMFKSKGIFLKSTAFSDEVSQSMNKSDFHSIEEESDTKVQ